MPNHHHEHGGHEHGVGHAHAHVHAPASFGRAFAIGIGLNLAFVALEAGYGVIADSVALIADAGHNLSDVLGLAMAWGAWALAKRPASTRFTYGLSASSILAALFNGLLLLGASGAIAWEAARRLLDPPAVEGGVVMLVAAAGIVVNGVTALLFARGGKDDINIRGAFLHMAADAAVSAGVVVSGLLTLRTGLGWIDPATSIVIVAVIVAGTWGAAARGGAAGAGRGAEPDRSARGESGARRGARRDPQPSSPHLADQHHQGRAHRAPCRERRCGRAGDDRDRSGNAARAVRDRPRHPPGRGRDRMRGGCVLTAAASVPI